MGEALQKILKMKKKPPLREELELNIGVAASVMRERFEKAIEPFGITVSQYNVLRILKGVYPNGHPRCEIMLRMIDRAPDITRLVDRLEKMGLVKRERDGEDRRMSISVITAKGLKLIEQIQPLIDNTHKSTTKDLSDKECGELSRLIEKLYAHLI